MLESCVHIANKKQSIRETDDVDGVVKNISKPDPFGSATHMFCIGYNSHFYLLF